MLEKKTGWSQHNQLLGFPGRFLEWFLGLLWWLLWGLLGPESHGEMMRNGQLNNFQLQKKHFFWNKIMLYNDARKWCILTCSSVHSLFVSSKSSWQNKSVGIQHWTGNPASVRWQTEIKEHQCWGEFWTCLELQHLRQKGLLSNQSICV